MSCVVVVVASGHTCLSVFLACIACRVDKQKCDLINLSKYEPYQLVGDVIWKLCIRFWLIHVVVFVLVHSWLIACHVVFVCGSLLSCEMAVSSTRSCHH